MINEVIKFHFNKSIKEDWLWNGRFVLSQTRACFTPYDDHSGGEFTVELKLFDTKTDKYVCGIFDNYNIEWQLWRWVNSMIIEYWNVWEENPDPREQAIVEGRVPN